MPHTSPGGSRPRARNLTIEQFLSSREELPSDELQDMLSMFNGGSFMECHQAVYEATGVWIEELVPVFQKFDATLATRDLRPRIEA